MLTTDYRRIWLGNASANLADGVTFVMMPLLAAAITADPVAVAGLSVAYSLTRIVAVLGVGVLVDRSDRRQLLVWANLSRAALFMVLTALVAVEATALVALYVIYAAMGGVETVSDGAAVAVLPQAVPRSGLDRANSQVAGTQIVVDEFIGPPLGGLLFAVAAFAPSGLSAAAFLVAGFAFWRLRGNYTVPDSEPVVPDRSVVALAGEGARWMWHHPVVRLTVVVGGIASVAYMIPFSYLVLYASDVLDLDSVGYGLLLSFSALGGLFGSAVAAPLRRRIGYGWSIVAALTVGASSFTVVTFTTNVVVVAVALATYIAHAVVWNVMAASILQRATPNALMGRVAAVGRLVGLIGLAAGAGAGGVLAAAFGYRAPFGIAAALFALATVLCLVGLPTLRRWEQPEETVSRAV